MDLDKLKSALMAPRYVSMKSAWLQHIPFAFAAVDWLRPRTVVELGTYMGDSYFAFCQAVETLKLDAQCTAVDTWSGDRHAGTYEATILGELRRYHDPLYGRFSRLLPCEFDEAAAQTADGSVDLLHIDGLHTYEAVRHDLETWLPKLSERGVVLLHDTQVKRDNFGVFSLWEEVRGRFPSFEFLHGYGLGVMAVGRAVPADFLYFLAWAKEHAGLARTFFESMGMRIELARGTSRVEASLDAQRAGLADALNLDHAPERTEPAAPATAAAATLLNEEISGLKQWFQDQCEAVQQQTELLRVLTGDAAERVALASIPRARAGADAAPAALSVYWPNAGGRFDGQHMQMAYLPADGNMYTARFCVELGAGGAHRRLRLDPGDRPGIWRIHGIEVRLLDGAGNRRIALPASILRAERGMALLNVSQDIDRNTRHDYVLLCGNSDPQMEMALGALLPAGGVTLEVTVHCRVWNSFGAYFASVRGKREGIVAAFRGLFAGAAGK